jgi:type VI secretion system secreted protein Hcp
MPIYMNWGNSLPPKIKGDVTESGHSGWIELFSTQLRVGRAASTAGSGSDQSGSGPAINEIVVTKNVDSSSSSLYQESLNGEGTKVLLDFLKSNADDPYLELLLTNVMVSSFSLSGGAGNPRESLTLNFTKLEWGSGEGVTPHTTAPPLSILSYQL